MATPKRSTTKKDADPKPKEDPKESVQGEVVNDDETDDQAAEKLAPVSAKIWIIGKPPEMGGNENEWGRYVQRSLSYIDMQRFIGYVGRTLSRVVREGGSGGLEELIGAGTPMGMIQRGRQIGATDFADATGFLSLAFTLTAHVPDFLLDCYCFWLGVPVEDQTWAKMVMAQRWDPDNDEWGMTRQQAREMTQIFIDQNYEEIRGFFVEDLAAMFRQIVEKESERRGTESPPSKQ